MAVKARPTYVPRKPAGPTPRTYALVGLAILVAALIGGAIGYAIAGPSASERAVADMEKADAARDVTQIRELTALTKKTSAELGPMLSGLAVALPQDPAATPQPADAASLASWRQTIERAAAEHAETVSGMTGTNVARGGFRSAVNALVVTLDMYAAAQKAPEGDRRALLDLVVRQRAAAVMMWSVAATQLDQLNVDAGNGHQHAYLSEVPGEGAMTADDIPEGTN